MKLCIFLLDVSGSMAGSPIVSLSNGINNIIGKIIERPDVYTDLLIGVYTFNSKLYRIVNIGQEIKHKLKFKAGGNTEFLSAIKGVANDLNKLNDRTDIDDTFIFVLTDGAIEEYEAVGLEISNLYSRKGVVTQLVGVGDRVDIHKLRQASLPEYSPVFISDFQIEDFLKNIGDFIDRRERAVHLKKYVDQYSRELEKRSKKEEVDVVKRSPYVNVFKYGTYLLVAIFAAFIAFHAFKQINQKEVIVEKEIVEPEENYVFNIDKINADTLKAVKSPKRIYLKVDEPVSLNEVVRKYNLADQYENMVVFNLLCDYNRNILLKNGYDRENYDGNIKLKSSYIKAPNLASLLLEKDDIGFYENDKLISTSLRQVQADDNLELISIIRIEKGTKKGTKKRYKK